MAEAYARAKNLYNVQLTFIMFMLRIQNKLILERVESNSFNLPYNIDALQTIKQILFLDKI